MKIAYYWKLLRGKTKALHPAKLDVKHIWAVFQAWIRCKLPVPKYISEQIIWRRLEVIKNSPECWKEGACVECGCMMVEKTKADMECEHGCYPPIMSKKLWKQFKINHNIKLFD